MGEYMSKQLNQRSHKELPTRCLHHSLKVLFLKLLDAFRFGFSILFQATKFVHILII